MFSILSLGCVQIRDFKGIYLEVVIEDTIDVWKDNKVKTLRTNALMNILTVEMCCSLKI